MNVAEIIAIATGVGVVIGQLLKKPKGTKPKCPKCKSSQYVIGVNDGGDELHKCENCKYELIKHGQPVVDDSKVCPSCSGHITLSTGTWTCQGYSDRASIVAQRGEKMTPPSLKSLPACGWLGRDCDYGRTWR